MKKLVKKQTGGTPTKPITAGPKTPPIKKPDMINPYYVRGTVSNSERMKPYPKQEKFNPSNVSKNGLILKKPIKDSIYIKPIKKGGSTKAKKK